MSKYCDLCVPFWRCSAVLWNSNSMIERIKKGGNSWINQRRRKKHLIADNKRSLVAAMNPLTWFWQNSFVIYCQPVFIFDFILFINFFCLPLCLFLAAKVRRLYDIANVLRSLKLIDKVHVTCEERGRKPAFEWVGPEDFPPIRGDFVLNPQSKHIATIMNFYLTRLKETLRSRPLLFCLFFLIPHHPPHHH